MNHHDPNHFARTGPDSAVPEPPVPPKRPRRLSHHGHTRTDDYYWLRDDTRSDPEVLAHLEAENRYTEAALEPTAGLRETVFREIADRIERNDDSVPLRLGEYWYCTRYRGTQEYPVYTRRRGSADGPEEVILDVNELAAGHAYFQVANLSVSDDHQWLAYAEDPVGRRRHTVRLKNLISGETLPAALPDTSGALAWGADDRALFYVRIHPETLRPYRVYRHRVGTPVTDDELVYQEDDPAFHATVYRGKSRRYVYLHLGSTVADEVRLLRADQPEAKFRVFLKRAREHEYHVADVDDRFYVLSNWRARNFQIFKTTLENAGRRRFWEEVVPHRRDTLITDFDLFADYLVVSERHAGLRRLRAVPYSGGEERVIATDEPAYAMYLDDNEDIGSNVLRYGYCSMTTPYTVYDLDLATGERIRRKQTRVHGDFDPFAYRTERIEIAARDGTPVPISLVYRRDLEPPDRRPLLVYGYGAYGISVDPIFVSSRLSLLDRGFTVALVHVRGGQEFGRHWYEGGKLLNKMNTFTDFIDATAGLIERGWGDPKRVYAMGGSAGGLLIGAVINLKPELYHGAIALVPFVDVVTTMLDERLPLTTSEFDEWGNPAEKEYYDYILSYSPYDQVKPHAYPNLLVMTGLHDSQVQYWEPAKWVARLRECNTGSSVMLLHTNMEAGHGGASGRFKGLADTALEYAFLLNLAGIDQ